MLRNSEIVSLNLLNITLELSRPYPRHSIPDKFNCISIFPFGRFSAPWHFIKKTITKKYIYGAFYGYIICYSFLYTGARSYQNCSLRMWTYLLVHTAGHMTVGPDVCERYLTEKDPSYFPRQFASDMAERQESLSL